MTPPRVPKSRDEVVEMMARTMEPSAFGKKGYDRVHQHSLDRRKRGAVLRANRAISALSAHFALVPKECTEEMSKAAYNYGDSNISEDELDVCIGKAIAAGDLLKVTR